VNACYGYSAVSRIRITQTSATGFAEAQTPFVAQAPSGPAPTDPALTQKARQAVGDGGSAELRDALERLGANIVSQSQQ
jgi:hypothetical protein